MSTTTIKPAPTPRPELPGYILDMFDGSAWITQDGQVTDQWNERGVWATPEEAEAMMRRCLRQNWAR